MKHAVRVRSFAKWFRHRMSKEFTLLVCCGLLVWPTVGHCQELREYSLTAEGVKLLQHIATKDQMVRDLPKGVAAFAKLNEIFSKVPGPTVSVVLTPRL